MGGGRGKAAAIIASGALALIGAGCGVEEHANDPRPIPSARLSVTLGNGAVTVAPSSVGLGPEHSKQIPQNRGRAQPPIRTRGPMVLTFVIANLTNTKTQLEIRGPHDTSSEPIVANGAGTFQAELPTGAYTLSAAEVAAAAPAHLIVGPYRASSQNEVLLP